MSPLFFSLWVSQILLVHLRSLPWVIAVIIIEGHCEVSLRCSNLLRPAMTFTIFSNMSQRDFSCLLNGHILQLQSTHWSMDTLIEQWTNGTFVDRFFFVFLDFSTLCFAIQAARGSDLLVACRSGWRPESTRSSFRTKKTCCNHESLLHCFTCSAKSQMSHGKNI